jgi:Ca2+-binding RTX toxin-like protein
MLDYANVRDLPSCSGAHGGLVSSGRLAIRRAGGRVRVLLRQRVSDTLSGSAVDNYINGGAGNDTINGRDGNDTLEGAAGNNALNGYGGNDTLKWDAADTFNGGAGLDALLYGNVGELDFSASKVSNIEAINLGVADNNNNGIALSLADILDIASTSSGTGLTANGDAIDLFVFGDNDGAVVDNVALTGGWTANGTIITDQVNGTSTTFNVYVAGTSQVAVQQALSVAAA